MLSTEALANIALQADDPSLAALGRLLDAERQGR